MYHDSNCLDTENRTSSSTLSIPVYNINRIAFSKSDRIKFHIVVPPMYNIDSTNNTITINGTNYSITNGFYEDIVAVITAFNTAIVSTGITIAINNITAIVTITCSSVFTFNSCPLLGFMSNQSGSTSYTATQATNLNRNTICFCSNLASLFSQINLNKQQESYQPSNFVMAFLNNAINQFNYIDSDWMEVNNPQMFDQVTFYFGLTGSTPSVINSVLYNWSVVLEIRRQ